MATKESNQLTKGVCVACHAESKPVLKDDISALLTLIPNWQLETRDNAMQLERIFSFKNYKLAWAFANEVSKLAESEGHHPAILLEWGKVTVTWWTHAIGGLHQNDIICAAKTDQLVN